MKHASLIIGLILITFGVTMRVLPHPDNFAPITALALFGGAILPRRLGIALPLLAMMISDTIIGWYDIMPVTWACYALIALASQYWLSQKRTLQRGLTLTLGASLFFFVVTNFAVWAAGSMYPHTWTGLQQCFVMAIPFFRNTALSDLIYTASLFGLYVFANRLANHLLRKDVVR